MMHLGILLTALGIAVLIRFSWSKASGTWADRWPRALGSFLLPPMLLLMTSMTVIAMGHKGMMLQHPVGWLGCHIALGFLAIAGVSLLRLLGQQWRSRQQIRSLPIATIAGRTGRVLSTSALFAAQVGFWKPELVFSQGLLQSMSPDQIEAVLSHEEAHCYYRDPFCFFWLSWLYQLTFWLPTTDILWQELLLLRELRADHWAAQQVDALTLAETLLLSVRSSFMIPDHDYIPFHHAASITRLEERITALMTQPYICQGRGTAWLWLIPALLPILILPFHHP